MQKSTLGKYRGDLGLMLNEIRKESRLRPDQASGLARGSNVRDLAFPSLLALTLRLPLRTPAKREDQ